MGNIKVEDYPAGKAINLAAAEVYAKLIGLERREIGMVGGIAVYYGYPGNHPGNLRKYIQLHPYTYDLYEYEWLPSIEIKDAWDLLIALMSSRRCWFEVKNFNALADGTPARYGCNIEWLDKDQAPAWSIPRCIKVEAETVPLAITRAFLLANGVQEIEDEIMKGNK